MQKHLRYLLSDTLFAGDTITGEEMHFAFTFPDKIVSLFESLAYFSKKIVTDTIQSKTPLRYWNGSVAQQNDSK